jgi:hypothetical protein
MVYINVSLEVDEYIKNNMMRLKRRTLKNRKNKSLKKN